MSRYKPILCLDFDGVIHLYSSGWQDGSIYDGAVPGFFAWATEAVKVFTLVVYSSRSSDPEQVTRMREWLGTQSIKAIERGEVPPDYDWGELFGYLQFADKKPPAFLQIDDRAICFKGDWSAPELNPDQLRNFKPWNTTK